MNGNISLMECHLAIKKLWNLVIHSSMCRTVESQKIVIISKNKPQKSDLIEAKMIIVFTRDWLGKQEERVVERISNKN